MEKIGVNIKIPYLCRMDIQPIAHFESPLKSKFGIPRQSGLVEELRGRIVFEKPFRQPEAVRGLESFDYLWLIWEFSANKEVAPSPTVRPPRLGGNVRMGVFATRSPYRPNPLGLSCVRLDHVEWDTPQGPVIHVRGADLMDGTPIYDIKPYQGWIESHQDADDGFVATNPWKSVKVTFEEAAMEPLPESMRETLVKILEQDPRPSFHDDPDRIYGMSFAGYEIHFQVQEGRLTILDIQKNL